MYKIMVVDDDTATVSIIKKALEKTYSVIPAVSGESAINLLTRKEPDLILLDINMPKMNGFDVISQLKTSEKFRNIPVIFLSERNDDANELEGFSLGAIDCIKKPLLISLLLKKLELNLKTLERTVKTEERNNELENMLLKKSKDITELQYAIIESIASLIEKKDAYSGRDVSKVQMYVDILIRELIERKLSEGIVESDIDIISISSKLYDIGKIAIPDNLLLKKTKLDPEEVEYMKLHTIMGAKEIEKAMRLISNNEFLKYAYQMAKSHHERWNGTGYPEKLSGTDIPLVARIMAIADIYYTLTSSYNNDTVISHDKAVTAISKNSGTLFDPNIVMVFESINNRFILDN